MSIWFCEMELNCPKQWTELKKTNSPLVMNCDECGQPVHWVETYAELENAATEKKCVAFYSVDNKDLTEGEKVAIKDKWNTNFESPKVVRWIGLPKSKKPMSDKLKAFIDFEPEKEKEKEKVEIDYDLGITKLVTWSVEALKQDEIETEQRELLRNLLTDSITANQSFSSTNYEVRKSMWELLKSYNFILKKCYVALDEIHTKEDRFLLAGDLEKTLVQLKKILKKV
jgi:hypothetical protein